MTQQFRFTQETFLAREKQFLAPYAVFSMDSKGRSVSEPSHTYRTCFQRDRDRVIHCSGFRRLEAKTQVYYSLESDYPRTRLTHTIEVAQIARTLARSLGVNEDLAEAAALAHDLGHPPYGHCGEMALDELMVDHGGFEHNQQSLRVVEYLEHPYPDFRGLNLSYETLECMAKHESRYDHPKLDARFGAGQATVEGQIADLADSIAYNSHDLDDALFFGLVKEKDLTDVKLFQQLSDTFSGMYPEANKYVRRTRCAKLIIDILAKDTVEASAKCLAKLNPQSPQAIRDHSEKVVNLSQNIGAMLEQLSAFLYANVYMHPDVSKALDIARQQLTLLFGIFLDDPMKLPKRYYNRLEDQGLHQVICDYLAGMTDRYCQNLYHEYKG